MPPQLPYHNADPWDASEQALADLNALASKFHDCKPNSKAPEAEKQRWEARIRPVRLLMRDVGLWRHAIVQNQTPHGLALMRADLCAWWVPMGHLCPYCGGYHVRTMAFTEFWK